MVDVYGKDYYLQSDVNKILKNKFDKNRYLDLFCKVSENGLRPCEMGAYCSDCRIDKINNTK